MPHGEIPSFARQTSSSAARERRHITSSNHSSSLAVSVEPSAPSLTISTSVKTKLLKLTEKTFRQDVFPRYGISITRTGSVWSPYQHFDTIDPAKEGFTGRMQDWYQKHHEHSSVWLEYDQKEADRIAGQYRNLIAARAKEAKLSFRGKNYFFKEDDVFGPEDDARCSSTYFELEWALNPDDDHLRCPPLLAGSESNFGFNTNPDCMYWLTTRRMNRDYSSKIDIYTHVLSGPQVAAPYLTIEFKKDNTSFEAAENQLAVSSTLLLYNRFRLRCSRLQAYGPDGNKESFGDIKHYGIAFNGSIATFYVAKPILEFDGNSCQLEGAWAGCELTRLAREDARASQGVIQIKQWVNEIHNWGMSKHSDQFVTDIKGLLLKEDGRARVSLLPEERAVSGIE